MKYWGSGGTVPLILDLFTTMQWVVNLTHRPLYSQRNIPQYKVIRVWVGCRKGLNILRQRTSLASSGLDTWIFYLVTNSLHRIYVYVRLERRNCKSFVFNVMMLVWIGGMYFALLKSLLFIHSFIYFTFHWSYTDVELVMYTFSIINKTSVHKLCLIVVS